MVDLNELESLGGHDLDASSVIGVAFRYACMTGVTVVGDMVKA